MRTVYLNGQFVPEADAKISIWDEGSMYGSTVFEMLRSYNQQHFKLDAHIDRLYWGLKALRIPEPMSKKELMDLCDDVTLRNCPAFQPDDEFRLMINVSRGPLGIYQKAYPQSGPTLCISCFPLRWTVAGMGALYDSGINGVVVNQRHTLTLPNVKHRSRLEFVIANQQAAQVAGSRNWAILLDEEGYVAEGTGANVFMVLNNALYTPDPNHCLKGISRDYVLDLAQSMDLYADVGRYNYYELIHSDEIFVTGTPFGALPVTSIDGISIGDGMPGPLYQRILDAWNSEVRVNHREQIQAWDAVMTSPAGSSPYAQRP